MTEARNLLKPISTVQAMILQICFGIFFLLFVRYGHSADALYADGHHDKELEENIEKYPGTINP